VPALEQDVLGLDVAVHDAFAMGVVQCFSDFARDAQGIRDGQLAEADESLAERIPLDGRHDVIKEIPGLAGVVQFQDVGVLEAGGRLDLLEEPRRPQRGGQLGTQHFQRNITLVLAIPGQVHHCHPAAAQLVFDHVPLGDPRLQTRLKVVHGH
jgi:hypothetical protein